MNTRPIYGVLTFTVLLGLFSPHFGSAQTDIPSQPDYSQCTAENRTTLAPEFRYEALLENPIPMSGRLPSPSLDDAIEGASYSIETNANGIRYVELDGVALVGDGRFGYRIETLDAVPFPALVEIVAFLGNFSDCASQPSKWQMASFLSDFGVGWACGPGDPFNALQSPIAAACNGSLSRTRGSVPLELYEARMLSDGRVALIVGEASNHDDAGHLISDQRVASLWILDKTERGWLIDVVIGGLRTTHTAWLNV